MTLLFQPAAEWRQRFAIEVPSLLTSSKRRRWFSQNTGGKRSANATKRTNHVAARNHYEIYKEL